MMSHKYEWLKGKINPFYKWNHRAYKSSNIGSKYSAFFRAGNNLT